MNFLPAISVTPNPLLPPEEIITEKTENREENDEEGPEHLHARRLSATCEINQGEDVENDHDGAAAAECPEIINEFK